MSVQSSSQGQRLASLRDRILAERQRRMLDSAGRRPAARRPPPVLSSRLPLPISRPIQTASSRLPLDRSRLPNLAPGRRSTLGRG